jgi:hypothetical protein
MSMIAKIVAAVRDTKLPRRYPYERVVNEFDKESSRLSRDLKAHNSHDILDVLTRNMRSAGGKKGAS